MSVKSACKLLPPIFSIIEVDMYLDNFSIKHFLQVFYSISESNSVDFLYK